MIIFITGIAMIVPDFTDFLNIAGALGCGLLAFVFPPLMVNTVYKDEISSIKKWSNYFIVGFGIVGSAYSIYTSIK